MDRGSGGVQLLLDSGARDVAAHHVDFYIRKGLLKGSKCGIWTGPHARPSSRPLSTAEGWTGWQDSGMMLIKKCVSVQ